MYLYFALSSYFDTYILHVVLTIMNAMRIKLEIYLCGALFPQPSSQLHLNHFEF